VIAPRIVGLSEFVHALTPAYTSPVHLAPITRRLERALVEPLRLVFSVPPRHAKTETVLHFVVWLLLQRPDLRVAYVSYAQTIAEKKSRKARELAKRAGVPIADDASSKRDWRTGVDDGGVWATSIEGQITGEGFDVIIVDDPVKDRAVAESPAWREKAWDWWNDTLFTRAEPEASVIDMQTRWHEDDLAGRLIRQGWENIVLPALDGEGRALWPERWPAARLQEVREKIGEYGWASLYQGQPRPRGGAVFHDVTFFTAEDLPKQRPTIRVGLDFAYTAKASADYSVAVALAQHEGRHFVIEVLRMQVAVPEFMRAVASLCEKYGVSAPTAYIGGTEKGLVDMVQSVGGLRIDARVAKADKFTRAQPVAAAWNAGKVLVPRTAPWVDAFVSEVVSFTGVNDRRDDQVDALAAAFDASAAVQGYTGPLPGPFCFPSPIGGW
jgi:predicted phage terminase large subunit-like protein